MQDAVAADMQQFGNVWSKCVVRAWQDARFREALKRDPEQTLREAFQFTVPAGVHLQVVENDMEAQPRSTNALRMVIPPAPEMGMGEIALADANAHGQPQCDGRFPFSLCCAC